MSLSQQPRCKNLVLDAGPLLSLSPLRGLAETFFTVPQVLAELKDKRAREHFERLGLQAGVRIEVRSPDPASLAHVIQFAKKTGDYSVLSHADICLVALTYALHKEAAEKASEQKTAVERISETLNATSLDNEAETPHQVEDEATSGIDAQVHSSDQDDLPRATGDNEQPDIVIENEGLDDCPPSLDNNPDTATPPSSSSDQSSHDVQAPLYEDPSDSDDGEGEWITPSNVALHKSHVLELLPNAGAKGKGKADEFINAGCMTADFAMQNVLLQMGLDLVSIEGRKIEKLKTWVLRCHACFKICKDASKKFCPSCGNPALLRASVTITTPGASSNPVMQIHLKKNFQYKTRGTIYSIPDPKPGSAKTGSGEGLILREDQLEYMRAKKRADAKREREEQKMMKGIFAKGEHGVGVGSWMDPDWMPEMMSIGAGGKGRKTRSGMDGDMPIIGYGRKNPNERKWRK